MLIRYATPTDVAEITRRVTEYYDIDLLPQDAEEHVLNLFVSPQCLILVVEKDGKVVGTAGMQVGKQLGSCGPLVGQELFWHVDKSKTAGKALCAALEKEAKEVGCESITLQARGPHQARLENMYKSIGYTTLHSTSIKELV